MLKIFRYERDHSEFPSGRRGKTPWELMELHQFITKEKVAIVPVDFLQATHNFCPMDPENTYSSCN